MESPAPGARARLLGSNAAWLIANRLVRILTGILVLGAVGRYLGPEPFGQLNYAIGLAAIFATLASLGFEGIVIRDLVREPHRTGEILGTALIMRVIGALIATVVVGLAAGGTTDSVGVLAVLVSLAFFPGAFDVIELWFQKNVDARSTFLPRTVATLLCAGFRILLIFWHAPLEVFACSQVLESTLGAVGLILIYRSKSGASSPWRWNGWLARRILRDSWPLIVSGVLIALYMRAEQILVKAVLGDYVLGVYYAAIRISETWSFLPAIILTTVYPLLVAKRQDNDDAAFREHLQLMFDVLTALGYAVAIGVSITAPLLIPMIFGPAYHAAIPILIIQAWTAPIFFNGAARAQYFLLENLTIFHTVSAMIGIALNVGLSLWWMKLAGAEGAALAALVAGFVSACGTSFLFPRLRESGRLQLFAFLIPFRLPSQWKKIQRIL